MERMSKDEAEAWLLMMNYEPRQSYRVGHISDGIAYWLNLTAPDLYAFVDPDAYLRNDFNVWIAQYWKAVNEQL